MRPRTALVLAFLAVAAVCGGGIALDRAVGNAESQVSAEPRSNPSGVWFCPHGGGTDWTGSLSLTNPTSKPVPVRVTTFGRAAPSAPVVARVPPRSRLVLQTTADSRHASSMVEFFEGWVAAGWITSGSEREPGVAAEPCTGDAGRTLLLPAGTTTEDEESWIVVMNPFASSAVFDLELVAEGRTVRPKELTLYVLPPRRSAAIPLGDYAFGERTLVGRLTVSTGRVAASALGVSGLTAGVWSAGPAARASTQVILPGGGDDGRSSVPVIDPGVAPSRYRVEILGPEGLQPAPGLFEQRLAPGGVRTEDIQAPDPSAVKLTEVGDGAVAAARRATGPEGDIGASVGVPAAGKAWVVNTAAAGPGSSSTLYLTNPEPVPATVLVTPLPQVEPGHPPVQVEIPAGATVSAPPALTSRPQASLLCVASSGTFVPLAASYTNDGKGYAVAAGVPVPERWLEDIQG